MRAPRHARPLRAPMLLLLAPIAGCVTTTPPRLSIADVTVTGVTDQGSSMVVVVRAENPNDKPLPLRNIDYRISLDGQDVFAATRAAEGVLPRFGTLDLALPVAVPAQVRPSGDTRFRLSLVVGYLAPGKIAETLYDAGISRPAVSGQGDATVNLGG